MSHNMFSVLDDSGDVSAPKKVEKPQQKTAPKEVKKTVPGMEEPKQTKQTTEPPKKKEVKKEVKSSEPKQNQDGFEQVSKTKHTGRPTKDAPKTEKKPGNDKPKVPPSEKKVRPVGDIQRSTQNKEQRPKRVDHDTKKEKHKVPIHPRGQRLHDHHDSSTPQKYNSKFVKKSGGGGHNWGKGTEELDVKFDKEEPETKETTETKEETKEETKVEAEPPKPLTKEEKKELKKKEKEALKKEKKRKGKDAGKEKSDELSKELVLTKVDPNAKTLDQYKLEQLEKKKQNLEAISKTLTATVKVETKTVVEEVKPVEKKKGLVDELFQQKKETPKPERKENKEKGKKNYKPNIKDSSSFPTLK